MYNNQTRPGGGAGRGQAGDVRIRQGTMSGQHSIGKRLLQHITKLTDALVGQGFYTVVTRAMTATGVAGIAIGGVQILPAVLLAAGLGLQFALTGRGNSADASDVTRALVRLSTTTLRRLPLTGA